MVWQPRSQYVRPEREVYEEAVTERRAHAHGMNRDDSAMGESHATRPSLESLTRPIGSAVSRFKEGDGVLCRPYGAFVRTRAVWRAVVRESRVNETVCLSPRFRNKLKSSTTGKAKAAPFPTPGKSAAPVEAKTVFGRVEGCATRH